MNNQDFFSELVEQIHKADREAIERSIEANTIIINSELDFVKEHFLTLPIGSICHIPARICNKHIFVGKLPEKYSFVLGHTSNIEELEYYKEKCEKLENQLKAIKEFINGKISEE